MPARGKSTRRAKKEREVQPDQQEPSLQVWLAASSDLHRLMCNRAHSNLGNHNRRLNVPRPGLGLSRKSRERRKHLLRPPLLTRGLETLHQGELRFHATREFHCGLGQTSVHHRRRRHFKPQIEQLGVRLNAKQTQGRTQKHLMKKGQNVLCEDDRLRKK
jgi:hypothetical protein